MPRRGNFHINMKQFKLSFIAFEQAQECYLYWYFMLLFGNSLKNLEIPVGYFFFFVPKHDLLVFPLSTLWITSSFVTNSNQMLFVGLHLCQQVMCTNTHVSWYIWMNVYLCLQDKEAHMQSFYLGDCQERASGRTGDYRVVHNKKISLSVLEASR